MIKAVIFDFGGVIISEGFQDWISTHIAPYETIKHEMMPLQDKVDRGDLPVSAYSKLLAKKTGKVPEEVEQEILHNYSLHKDTIALIRKLRAKGVKTAVLSNFPGEWFNYLRKEFQFDHLFDVIIISSEIHLIKPEKEFFKLALKKLHVTPDEAVFTDDKLRYVEGAEAMGIHGVVFTSAKDVAKKLYQLGIRI